MSRVMSPNLTAPPDLRARTAEQARSATKRATAKANRRRSWPRWTGTALRMGSLAAVATIAAGMGLWLWQGGWIARTWADLNQRAIHLTVEAGLQVHEVLVEGRSETDAGQLMAALRIRRGDPILLFNPDGARAELERLPWVANATVERRLPDTIYVNLSERRPMALWQRDHKLALIDVDGVVLTERALDRYSRLPILVGPDAPKHAPELLGLLASEPALARRVEAATRVGSRRWDLRLDNGVDIRLPETGLAQALHTLAELQAKSPFLDKDIVAVDLRLPDRLTVQSSAAAAQRRHMPPDRIKQEKI